MSTEDDVKYPQVEVRLTGMDGNAMSVIARASKAMRRAGVPEAGIVAYRAEATAGDYDNVLRVTASTVNVL